MQCSGNLLRAREGRKRSNAVLYLLVPVRQRLPGCCGPDRLPGPRELIAMGEVVRRNPAIEFKPLKTEARGWLSDDVEVADSRTQLYPSSFGDHIATMGRQEVHRGLLSIQDMDLFVHSVAPSQTELEGTFHLSVVSLPLSLVTYMAPWREDELGRKAAQGRDPRSGVSGRSLPSQIQQGSFTSSPSVRPSETCTLNASPVNGHVYAGLLISRRLRASSAEATTVW